MKVLCAPELFEKFPAASVHGVAFERLGGIGDGTAKAWKSQTLRSIRESGIRLELLTEVPEIKEWRAAFQSFGLKPSKYRSSIEQLYRRALKADIIETRLPLVNLYCYVSIIHRAPMGGYDLDAVCGDIAVRPASEGEEFTAIGEKQALRSEAGVVVYADQGGVICWGWNHRDCARTCLTTQTRRAIFFADAATENTRKAAEQSIETLSEILTSAGGVKVAAFTLDQTNHEAGLLVELARLREGVEYDVG